VEGHIKDGILGVLGGKHIEDKKIL